jgi:hypothetical protein
LIDESFAIEIFADELFTFEHFADCRFAVHHFASGIGYFHCGAWGFVDFANCRTRAL